jgi:hypothetical protein
VGGRALAMCLAVCSCCYATARRKNILRWQECDVAHCRDLAARVVHLRSLRCSRCCRRRSRLFLSQLRCRHVCRGWCRGGRGVVETSVGERTRVEVAVGQHLASVGVRFRLIDWVDVDRVPGPSMSQQRRVWASRCEHDRVGLTQGRRGETQQTGAESERWERHNCESAQYARTHPPACLLTRTHPPARPPAHSHARTARPHALTHPPTQHTWACARKHHTHACT